MLFNSAVFGLFIALVIPLYWAIRRSQSRKWLLLVASYVFYANWNYRYLPLLALSTVVDYAAGSRLALAPVGKRRRAWLLASLITNLGILGLFKYGNFLVGSLGPLWEALHVTPFHLPDNIPVGISFYTFQTMSYTIDVYRGRTERCKSPLDFALYVSFFAQLVAGPIVRSTDFLPQIERMRDIRLANLSGGARRFLLGLFKKVVIADNVGLFVGSVFGNPGEHTALTLWAGAWGFALQVYCDFSAYSDMAIDIGRTFGIRIPENFQAPYLARSISEFWQRWHISLSTWLRDYLYIPLGGSRRGTARTYYNLMLTMLLGGLWHGASWNFVIWGGFHGVLLALERFLGLGTDAEARRLGRLPGLLRAALTFNLHCLSLVVFRTEGLADLLVYIPRMFTAWTWSGREEALGVFWAAVLLAMVTAEYFVEGHRLRERAWDRLSAEAQGFVLAILVLAVSFFHVDEVAFIYFQF
ncbi:MAG: MBOAT family protein [Candidatus Eisenbacteria bacterium]